MIITNYELIPTPREKEAIDWLEANFPGKLAAFIAKYLEERHVNMLHQENEAIIKHIDENEKAAIKERINARKLESTDTNK